MRVEKKVFQPEPIISVELEMATEDMGILLAALRFVERSWLPSWMRPRFDVMVGELAIMEEELSDEDTDYDPSIGG